ncbi:MAG: AMP-binding protein, partial [Sulfuricaulis sp.]|nr:AMP-binding protein [Sulfuricaulis sp.]
MSTILTLHDPQTARGYYASGVWRPDTMYMLLAGHARTRPRAFALRDSARRITWAQLLAWVDALAAELHAAGLRRGQRVSVWLPNRVEAVVVMLACSRNGYVCNPSLHQNYTVGEIVRLLERIQTAVLFAQPGYGADVDRNDVFAQARALACMKRIYRLAPGGTPDDARGDPAAFPPIEKALPDGALPEPDLNPDKIVYLAFTSGTTGMPKGVLHSDKTLLANGRAMVKDWHHDDRTILF